MDGFRSTQQAGAVNSTCKPCFDVQPSPRLPASPVRQSDKPLGNTIEPRAGIFPFQYCANMIYFSQELGK